MARRRRVVHVVVEPAEGREGWYVATSPDLPGLVTHGSGVDHTLENVKDAIVAYSSGKPPAHTLNVRVVVPVWDVTRLPRDADVRRVLKALHRPGFRLEHVSGAHYRLVHEEDSTRVVTVPFHGTLPTGTLRSILRSARIEIEEFPEVFSIL